MNNPKFLAVKKVIPNGLPVLAEAWWREVKALERLKPKKHAHIVRFVTSICLFDDYNPSDYMIFEWADGGNLGEFDPRVAVFGCAGSAAVVGWRGCAGRNYP